LELGHSPIGTAARAESSQIRVGPPPAPFQANGSGVTPRWGRFFDTRGGGSGAGAFDDTLLEALEDHVKRQQKRLTRPSVIEKIEGDE